MVGGARSSSGGVTRTTILARDFRRLRLDENDLARLSEIVQGAANAHGGGLEIQIRSYDGVDVIDADSPDVFYGKDLPTTVRSVSISFADPTGSLQCKIELGNATDEVSGVIRLRYAGLRVEGREAREVQGLFHSLDRELGTREVRGGWMWDSANPSVMSGRLLLSGIVEIFGLTFALWDLMLRWAVGINITQWDRLAQLGKAEAERSTGLAVVAAVIAVACAFGLLNALIRAYPTVEFHGRMTDPTAVIRGRIRGLVVLLALPFIVDVISALYVYLFLRGA